MNRAAAQELLRQYSEWLGATYFFYSAFGDSSVVVDKFLDAVASDELLQARGVDLVINDEGRVFFNGGEVLTSGEEAIEISAISSDQCLTARLTVFLNSLVVRPKAKP